MNIVQTTIIVIAAFFLAFIIVGSINKDEINDKD